MIQPFPANLSALRQRALTRVKSCEASLRGAGWMTVAELGNRVSRIATAVALARSFSLPEFAAMSLVLTTYELIRMFIHNGVGARIVGARDDELDVACEAVNRINWIVGGGMCALQLLLAAPLQAFFNADIASTLAVLAVVHLIYPLAMTQGCLAQRREQFGVVAGMQFVQMTGDNLLTAGMALAGLGVWAVVVPKIVIAVVWVAGTLLLAPGWRRVPLSRECFQETVRFGRYVFFSEALNTLRNNADRLIVSKALGPESFAIYAFASNAGSGIATGLASALGQVALPYLAKGSAHESDSRRRFWAVVKGMCLVIAPLILVQAAMAPIYVPLFFGERWRPAIPVLIVMCLGALARPIAIATTQMLRATGAVGMEFKISQWSAVVFFGALFAGLPFGVMGVALSLFVATTLSTLAFVWITLIPMDTRDRAFRKGIAFAKGFA